MRDKYSENIDKLLRENYAETVPETELTREDGSMWYPHHPVLSDNKSGKGRTVFDRSNDITNLNDISEFDTEIKSDKSIDDAIVAVCHVNEHPLQNLIEHYSSFYRLKQAHARLIRIVKCFQGVKQQIKLSDPITSSELETSETILIKYVQDQCYRDEIQSLENKGNVKS